jgi:hypothetical protein
MQRSNYYDAYQLLLSDEMSIIEIISCLSIK